MHGLMYFDGHRHVFLPVDGLRPLDRERAVQGLSSPTLARIAQAGEAPSHGADPRYSVPDCNDAAAMRLVHAEIQRRKDHATYFDRVVDTAAEVHARRRWLDRPLSNYGRTV